MDGLVMANKKATPAASTPAQSYPDPYWPGTFTGPSWGQQVPMVQTDNGVDYTPQGGMANTPRPGWGYRADQQQVTPTANAAAMRNYMRYAGPDMQGAISSPDNILAELRTLGDASENDVVSQYRKRFLMSALRDIYGTNPYDVGPGYALSRGMSQTPDAGYTPTTPRSK